MTNKPNPTLAGFLCLISPPLGMLYAARAAWAAVYFFALLGVGVLALIFLHSLPLVGLVSMLALCVASMVHAYRLASAYPAERTRPRYSRWYGLLGIFLGAAVVLVGLRAFLFEPFRIPSGNMMPTLEVGSMLFVQKWGYGHYGSFGVMLSRRPISAALRRGDIIVFDRQNASGATYQFVERLVGLPGDTVAYRDKKLSINGSEVPQVREGDYTLGSPAGALYLARYAESMDGGSNYSVLIKQDAPWAHTEALVRQQGCIYDERGETCKIPAGHYFVMGDNRDDSYDSRYWGFVPAERIVGKVVQVF